MKTIFPLLLQALLPREAGRCCRGRLVSSANNTTELPAKALVYFSMTKTIDDQWREWIRHNVARGCSKHELFDILVREGFERREAYSELNPLHIPALSRLD